VQHDALEDKNDQDHQRLRINAQEATDLIKILRGLEGKTLDILDIYKYHKVTIPTNQESRQLEVPTRGYARITECNMS
jgi:hypothetical protein